MHSKLSRKSFLKTGLAVAAGLGAAPDAGRAAPDASDPREGLVVRLPGRDYCWQARIEQGRLAELTPLAGARTPLWLTRGLVDIQVNGYQGVNLTLPGGQSSDQLAACEQALAAEGTARWCPTITSDDPQVIRDSLAAVDRAVRQGALKQAHCIHLEANFLSSEEGYRGAHLARWQQDPDLPTFESFQQAAGGRIGYVTLAPERKGAIEFIKYLSAKGVLVALGHFNAPPEVVAAAVDAGARLSTHLFNGCAGTMHRHHNVILTQLAEDRLWASFLPDGHHIPHHVLKVGLRAKGLERAVFTSDLVHLGGLPEGVYAEGEQQVEVRDGAVFLKGTPYLYGAWCSLAKGIERATAAGIIAPGEALRLASTNPARLLRLEDDLTPAVGARGPFVLFREEQGALRLDRIIS